MPPPIHIAYRHTDSLTDAAIGALVSALPQDERERCGRFVFARDRRDFAAAHELLRRTLSRFADRPPGDWTFLADANGKPYLLEDKALAVPGSRDSGVPRFNLSHTRGLVACAVAAGLDLGVDVESIDRSTDGLEIAERFFSPPELAMLNGCPAADRATRFIELWTLKESYIKAVGTGLSHPLHTFWFEFEGERGLRFHAPPGVDAAAWTFALYAPGASHRLAIGAQAGPAARHAEVACIEDGAAAALAPTRRSTYS